MAEYLASIFGTEKDKVNCSFYFKIGACRHGDKCSRIHNKPTFSQTVLLQNLYQNPKRDMRGPGPVGVSDAEEQQHFDEFFEEIFTELEDKYGEIEEMNVCDNIGEHMIGNVYVKFKREEDAEKAVEALNNRWFGGAPVYAELSPVTDFREACCRQYEMGECTRGGFCNFMHLKPISYELRRELYNRDHPWRKVDRKLIDRRKKPKRRRRAKGNEDPVSSGGDHSNDAGSSGDFDTDEDVWKRIELLGGEETKNDSRRSISPKTMATHRRSRSVSIPKSYHIPDRTLDSPTFSDSISPTHVPGDGDVSSFARQLLMSRFSEDQACSSLLDVSACITNNNSCSDCGKGGFCNFMHLKPISRELRRRLYGRKKAPSPGPGPRGGGGGGGGGGGRYDRDRDRRRSRSRSRDRRGGRF